MEVQEPSTEVSSRFARAVRVYLAARDLDQKDLAHQAGVTPGYLSDVMTGKRPVSMGLVLKLSAALNLDPKEKERLMAAAGHASRDQTAQQASSRYRHGVGTGSRSDTGAAVFGSPISLQGTEDTGSIVPFGQQLSDILVSADLPRHERKLAEELIKGAARVICQGLKDDLEQQDQGE